MMLLQMPSCCHSNLLNCHHGNMDSHHHGNHGDVWCHHCRHHHSNNNKRNSLWQRPMFLLSFSIYKFHERIGASSTQTLNKLQCLWHYDVIIHCFHGYFRYLCVLCCAEMLQIKLLKYLWCMLPVWSISGLLYNKVINFTPSLCIDKK